MFFFVHLLFSVLPALNHLARHTICYYNRLCTYRYHSSGHYISIGISLFLAPPYLCIVPLTVPLSPTDTFKPPSPRIVLSHYTSYTHTHECAPACSPFNIKLHAIVGPRLSKTFNERIHTTQNRNREKNERQMYLKLSHVL